MKSFIYPIYILIFVLFLNINPLVARILAPSSKEDSLSLVASSSKENNTNNPSLKEELTSTTSKDSTTNNTANTEDTAGFNNSTDNTNKQVVFYKSIIIHNSFKENPSLIPMIGVINSINPNVGILDTGINVKAKNMLENAYLLYAQVLFWPKGTIFVANMGSEDKNTLIIAKTKNGQIIITPNNGMLTLFVYNQDLDTIRILDKSLYKYQTIDGKDTIFYVAATLAKENSDITNIGENLPIGNLKLLDYPQSKVNKGEVQGTIFVSNNYKQIITNIPTSLIVNTFANNKKTNMAPMDTLEDMPFNIKINNGNNLLFEGTINFHNDYRATTNKKILSFYKNMLIIKNINLSNAPNLANPNYTILVSKITTSTKSSIQKTSKKNKSHSQNKV